MRVLVLAAVSLVWLGSVVLPQSLAGAQAAEATELPSERVLLFEAEALRPDLCAALRIQLTDVAEVRCRAEQGAGPLSERIAGASQAVAREQLRLAILLERDPDPGRVRMLLVGAAESQALLAIESIEDRPAPDVDRSLALKVRDSLQAISASAAQVAPEAALAVALAPKAEALEERRSDAFALVIEPGAALSVGKRARAAGVLGMGARVQRGAGHGELLLRAQVSSSLAESSALGTVVEDEWEVALSLRVGRTFGRVSLGAVGELGAVRVSALGVGPGGRGERQLVLARLGVGVDMRLLLYGGGAAPLWLRAAPTLQIDPVAQRFAIDDEPVLALGRTRAWLPLSLLIELPLTRVGANDG